MTTMTLIHEVADQIRDYGYWATYAVLRGYGQSRKRALWLMWVARCTTQHKIKFRM